MPEASELMLPRSVAQPGVVMLTRASLQRLSREDEEIVRHVLDTMGKRSMRAQGLSKPITTFGAMLGSDFRLYLSVAAQGVVRGLLKVGTKQLFVRRKPDAEYSQVSPLCVLDFYVSEACQRCGVGSALFEHMLRSERTMPPTLGYDRPSSKLLAFLAKHYSLKQYVSRIKPPECPCSSPICALSPLRRNVWVARRSARKITTSSSSTSFGRRPRGRRSLRRRSRRLALWPGCGSRWRSASRSGRAGRSRTCSARLAPQPS